MVCLWESAWLSIQFFLLPQFYTFLDALWETEIIGLAFPNLLLGDGIILEKDKTEALSYPFPRLGKAGLESWLLKVGGEERGSPQIPVGPQVRKSANRY